MLPFIYGMLSHNLELPARRGTRLATILAIKQMFHSLHVVICILMSPRDLGEMEIDGHVKVFLSCCHRFARSYYTADVVPFWATKGNFPTLLLLAEQRRIHGPVRWYWEGTSERFIQQLKKHLASMSKTIEYFTKKLVLMHKSLLWIGLRRSLLRVTRNRNQERGKCTSSTRGEKKSKESSDRAK